MDDSARGSAAEVVRRQADCQVPRDDHLEGGPFNTRSPRAEEKGMRPNSRPIDGPFGTASGYEEDHARRSAQERHGTCTRPR